MTTATTETRFHDAEFEVRSGKKSSEMVLTGYPIVWDQPGTVYERSGSYTEYVKPNATRGLEDSRIALLYNHDRSKPPLASTWDRNKSLTWEEDDHGVKMRAVLDKSRHDCHDLAQAVRRRGSCRR